MAKQGLSYYAVDTDRYADRKIKKLKHSFGCSGLAVYDYLLCEVYRDRGCVLEWDEDTAFDVADYFGLKVTTVKEIVKYCGAVGLFDAELLSRGIITSEAIQKRYVEMCNRARRPNIEIPEEIRLFTQKTEKLRKNSEETQKITQVFDKVNNSKVNNSKRDNKLSLCNAHTCATDEERERFLEIFTFVLNFKEPTAEVERFIAHYDASGWCRNNNTIPVKNKEALARTWKPKDEGARFPEEVRSWLLETYGIAGHSDTQAAKALLHGITRIDYAKQGAGATLTIVCTKPAMQAIEQYHAQRAGWVATYRIPN
jgi:hypothetical protein